MPIGKYLKGTMDKGLILNPINKIQVDCFPDNNFAGLYGHKDVQDPHCARSQTGSVAIFYSCPVLWKSQLKTEIVLSTMEAEYVALSMSCKELFLILDKVSKLCKALYIQDDNEAHIHIKVHKDNAGALTLAGLEPC